jgi:hypothetical protein
MDEVHLMKLKPSLLSGICLFLAIALWEIYLPAFRASDTHLFPLSDSVFTSPTLLINRGSVDPEIFT